VRNGAFIVETFFKMLTLLLERSGYVLAISIARHEKVRASLCLQSGGPSLRNVVF
jgi:hypothetical protein